jgi:hypothetical protein
VLDATDGEVDQVKRYMASQAPDLVVVFLQKVHIENVLGYRHEIWDVHCDKQRWWVITNPTNLYSQEQFPSMDLALTFHVGLSVRIPRSEKQKLADTVMHPFAECARLSSECMEALSEAEEVSDFQAVGVRCREALLAFTSAAQIVVPWTGIGDAPQRANLKAWADHIFNTTLAGKSHAERRSLFKTLLTSAWDYSNWLAHTKSSNWYDAEAAALTSEQVIGISISVVVRHIRKVPETCPSCRSSQLSPQVGTHTSQPAVEWERPVCEKCGWAGEPVLVSAVPALPTDFDPPPPDGACIIPTVPLRKLKKPNRSE